MSALLRPLHVVLIVLLLVDILFAPPRWQFKLEEYQKRRLMVYFGIDFAANAPPSERARLRREQRAHSYNVEQALISVGSGGWFGKGLTNGTQNGLDFLPVQTTDFVFALLGEELGFIGAMLVFLLFGALLWRVLTAAWRSRDPFGLLFSSGIASMLLFQLTVNVGMVIGVMPVTGIPLPFITHGGASLISTAVGLGILQSINMHQRRAEW